MYQIFQGKVNGQEYLLWYIYIKSTTEKIYQTDYEPIGWYWTGIYINGYLILKTNHGFILQIMNHGFQGKVLAKKIFIDQQ